MKLVKVRFIRDAVYRVRGYSHPDNPVFKQDAVHEFREDIARRWLKRGDAVTVTEQTSKPHDDELPAAGAPAASSPDGDDGGDKSVADKRKPRKGVAGDN